jgi:hypothetical protein
MVASKEQIARQSAQILVELLSKPDGRAPIKFASIV